MRRNFLQLKMKKSAFSIIGMLFLLNTAYAGGILTNTNQSAQFLRTMARNASIDLDAAYYNPAGLTQLQNGFYFGLHNQTAFQTRTINSGSFLKYPEYEGKVVAPVFPSVFAVYKKENWAFSAGFGPNGGGGSAEFKKGLPSFEKKIAKLVPSLAGLSSLGYPVTDYDVDIAFEGTSVFWGIQVGASYKINDIISVSAGVRFLPATNTYSGTISNIRLGSAGALVNGQTYLTGAANVATAKAQATSLAASSLQSLVKGGAGNLTLAQVQGAGYISAAQRAQLESGLQGLGLSAAQISGISISAAQSTYSAASTMLSNTASQLNENSKNLADKVVDTQQTGTGITPIVNIDIHLEKLNIGLRYEHKTTLKLINSTKVDDIGLFPDGATTRSDLPAIIAGGADYKVTPKLKASGSFTVFLDKNVNWGRNAYDQDRTIDKNLVELGFGLEYQLTKKVAVSAGYMNSNTGVSEQFQSDLSFSNDSYTIGSGFQWKLNQRIVLDAGMMLSTYKNDTKTFTDPSFGTYAETYKKETLTFAFGIGYKIF